MTQLSSTQVLEIRTQLELTREALATHLDVSPDAIKKWEAGDRPCSGPAAVLLRLLQRAPNAMALLDDAPASGLPSPRALEGSPEWFRLQRLLGILEFFGRGTAAFEDVVDEERLTVDWLLEAEDAELVRRHARNYELREATSLAERRLKLDLWLYWVQSQRIEDSRAIPPLTLELLREVERCRQQRLRPEQATERLAIGRT